MTASSTPTGKLKLTNSWSVMADYLHYWTPTIRQAVFGSYWSESFGSSIRNKLVLLKAPPARLA